MGDKCSNRTTETVLAELQQLNAKAKEGDAAALPQIRQLLDTFPELWRHFGDVSSHVEAKWLDLAAGTDAVVRESILREMEERRTELLQEGDSPLERLLIDRIVVSSLMTSFFDTSVGLSTEQPKSRVTFLQRQLDRAQRRHIAAIKALAEVRKLLTYGVS